MNGGAIIRRIGHHAEALAIAIGVGLIVTGFFVWQIILWPAAIVSISFATYLRIKKSRE